MKGKILLLTGSILVLEFMLWTVLVQYVDVQPIGQNGTLIGFAALNSWFHDMTGVNMTVYYITDWLGLVPILCCVVFGGVGFVQLINVKSLLKVDVDILLLGIYYIIVIFSYLIFEMIPINYRPILIDGIMESSYPSSTTLLVLSVMPTVIFQVQRRMNTVNVRNLIITFAISISAFTVIGRAISGVHWLTDIIGSILLSSGLYLIYHSSVVLLDKKRRAYNGIQ